MTEEFKNLAWQCLPKEAREEMRRTYKYQCRNNEYNRGFNEALEEIFGHNLTSDEEPSELLFVEREDVIAYFAEVNKTIDTSTKRSVISQSLGKQTALKSFFGDKCLPDEEPSVQVEPMFMVGDKVVVKNAPHIFRTVTSIEENGLYVLDHVIYDIKESDLEPYTEPESEIAEILYEKDGISLENESKIDEMMEEKELNRKALYDALCELESASAKVRKALIQYEAV